MQNASNRHNIQLRGSTLKLMVMCVCVCDQLTCSSMRWRTSSLSWWIRNLTQWWMMGVYLRYTYTHTLSSCTWAGVWWCQMFTSCTCAGVCQSAAGVQSVAAGGTAAAQTYHQLSDTEDKSEGKGHSSSHTVWWWQWWWNTGTSQVLCSCAWCL